MVIHLFTLSLLVVSIVLGQLESPCPDVLVYEPRSNSEKNRWYGVISISTTEDLEGLWLKITLDRRAELLENWFAESVTSDNIEYSIRNSSYTLKAGPPVSIRFFVEYNADSIVPTVKKIQFNGNKICSSKNSESTEPILHISKNRFNGGTNSRGTTTKRTGRPSRRTRRDTFDISSFGFGELDKTPSQLSDKTDIDALLKSIQDKFSNDDFFKKSSIFDSSNFNSPNIDSSKFGTTIFKSSSFNSPDSDTSKITTTIFKSSNFDSPDNDSSFFKSSTSRLTSRIETVQRESTPTAQRTAQRTAQPTAQPKVQCGVTAQRASPLITHGQGTTPGQWPWHIALYSYRYKSSEYFCGGSLVSEQYVVTAAHCVTKSRTTIPINKNYLIVYLGKYSLVSFGSEVQDREVDQMIIHPDFNASVYVNDIAILKLSEPVEINEFVRPICLWEEDNNIENMIGHQGTVVGWGIDETKELSKRLMQAQMPIVSASTCLFSNRNFFSQFLFDTNYCAGFRNGTSACNGDSGGGMVFPKDGTNGKDTVWQLRGVVSLSVALEGEAVCNPHQYIIFTDAAKYVNWIRRNIN